jgi:transcriptional regulator with XRE-family HTH domain
MKIEELLIERVLSLLEAYQLTPAEFAERIDVQRSSISHLMSRRNKPSLDFIQKVLNHFPEINPNWLVMGIGPMKQLDLFDALGKPAEAPTLPVSKKVDLQSTTESIETNPLPESKIEIPQEPIPIIESKNVVVVEEPLNKERSKEQIKTPDVPLEAFTPMSDPEKKIVRVMFFYSDNTFDSFKPNV